MTGRVIRFPRLPLTSEAGREAAEKVLATPFERRVRVRRGAPARGSRDAPVALPSAATEARVLARARARRGRVPLPVHRDAAAGDRPLRRAGVLPGRDRPARRDCVPAALAPRRGPRLVRPGRSRLPPHDQRGRGPLAPRLPAARGTVGRAPVRRRARDAPGPARELPRARDARRGAQVPIPRRARADGVRRADGGRPGLRRDRDRGREARQLPAPRRPPTPTSRTSTG